MSLLIILVGVYGMITSPNLIKKVMCLALIESMVILQFLGVGFERGDSAPILHQGTTAFVDPVPQALMLTAIVIGVCFNALAVALIVKLHKQRGTVDVRELHDL
jgi:multicomponent Na+:H+ antiporter subunit C